LFISNKIKLNYRVLRKNEEDTYGAPVFAPDYSAAVLAAKMCTNSHEHSMYNSIGNDINSKNIFLNLNSTS